MVNVSNMSSILITSVPGVEDIVIEELKELARLVKVEQISPGKLLVFLNESDLERFLLKVSHLRSIERVILVIFDDVLDKPTLDNIALAIRTKIKEKGELFKYATPLMSYSVQVKRTGRHKFTSVDVARVVGETINLVIKETFGKESSIRLECPDIKFDVEVIDNRLIFGIDVTGPRPLHEREYKVYLHPSSLNPIIAYAMIKLAKIKPGHRVLDPMCGSATILIECGLYYENVELYGVDINPKFLEGAKINIRKAGLENRIKLLFGDATSLEEFFSQNYFDRVLSNLPYGIRSGSPYSIQDLYSKFLSSVKKVLKDDGLLVLLTARRRALERAIRLNNFKKVSVRVIEQGGLYSAIYLLRP